MQGIQQPQRSDFMSEKNIDSKDLPDWVKLVMKYSKEFDSIEDNRKPD
jgi:hypothetical protein